jgi:NAD(P)H-flavin reductase
MVSNRHRSDRNGNDNKGVGIVNVLKPARAIIEDVVRETKDIRTYRFLMDGNPSEAPGPGQFNMVGYPGVGEAPISFSGLSDRGVITHTVRTAGMVTGFMSEMKRGAEIFIRGPYGKGWPMERARGADLIIAAGGLGLAPLRPVIHEVLRDRQAYGEVFILYGARDETCLLFSNEFDTWHKSFPFYITVDELVTDRPWNHHTGLITSLLDMVKTDPGKTAAFICGPEIMMRFLCKGMIMKGVRSSSLFVSLERRMKCGTALCGHCQHGGFFVCKDGPVFSYDRVAGFPDGIL